MLVGRVFYEGVRAVRAGMLAVRTGETGKETVEGVVLLDEDHDILDPVAGLGDNGREGAAGLQRFGGQQASSGRQQHLKEVPARESGHRSLMTFQRAIRIWTWTRTRASASAEAQAERVAIF